MPSDAETREARRQEILSFLHRSRVASQQEVVDHLVQIGLAATQSSAARMPASPARAAPTSAASLN